MIVGWIGVGLLVTAYILLVVTKIKWFYFIDAIASVVLTLHAILIGDIPFILVNGFIAIVLIHKYKEETRK